VFGCLRPLKLEAPKDDPRAFLPVPCGNCRFCIEKRRNDWSLRIHQEIRTNAVNAWFITLTYDDENLPRLFTENGQRTWKIQKDREGNETGIYEVYDGQDNSNVFNVNYMPHVSAWIKRLRQAKVREVKRMDRRTTQDQSWYKPTRYFTVGEYGSKFGRSHYHLIATNIPRYWLATKGAQLWPHGAIHVEPATQGTIHYTTGYLIQPPPSIETASIDRQRAQMSKKPGLGYKYLHDSSIVKFHAIPGNDYMYLNGMKLPLPRYYMDWLISNEVFDETHVKYSWNNISQEANIRRSQAWIQKTERDRNIIEDKLIHKFRKYGNPLYEIGIQKENYHEHLARRSKDSTF
jgi:hypothetical protein